jgi:hypothetical protein
MFFRRRSGYRGKARHVRLRHLARILGAPAVAPATIIHLLYDVNVRNCNPPLSRAEVEAIAREGEAQSGQIVAESQRSFLVLVEDWVAFTTSRLGRNRDSA